MAPRIPLSTRASLTTVCFRPAPPKGHLPTASKAHASSQGGMTHAERLRYGDPYRLAQAKAKKAANISRQEALTHERAVTSGDPVRGVSTRFLDSFDTVGESAKIIDIPETGLNLKNGEDVLLNHFLKPEDLVKSLEHSKLLTEPVVPIIRDPVVIKEQQKRHEEGHARAVVAMSRILTLANASREEKTRANTRRCIETFGRHNTDGTLKPRPATSITKGQVEKTPRAGPDTGSSEVQIAILTVKIKALADALDQKRGNKDKVGKRSLRLMVHKRQKLLKYLWHKERGGDRWKHLVKTLGLGDASWRGEISL